MKRLIIVLAALGCLSGAAWGQTVIFDLNVYPETESWEVVARVDGDGRPEDGLAGYFFRLTPNLTWFQETPPLITGASVGQIGFDTALNAEFGSGSGAYREFVGGHGQTLFVPDGDGILFDVGSAPGGEVPDGATARNVPWTRPVVLAVGGYDTSTSVVDFNEEGNSPFVDANVFVKTEDGGFRVIAADGTEVNTDITSGTSNFAYEFADSGGFYASLGSPSIVPTDEPVPLNIVLEQQVIAGVSGPEEGMVPEWLASRPVPEPSSWALAVGVALIGWGYFIERRQAGA